MRIIVFGSEFPPGPGGIGTHAFELARHLTLRGWQVAALTHQDFASDAEIRVFNQRQPFAVRRLRYRPALVADAGYRLLQLDRLAARFRPHVLLASGGPMVWLAALWCGGRGIPWLAVGHGLEFGAGRLWERVLTRWAFSQASMVVAVSHYTRRRMLSLGVRPVCDLVIPNGADERCFQPCSQAEQQAFRRRLGLVSSRLLLTVGNVTERKGQDVVIRALPAIRRHVPDVRYLLVGLPTRRQALFSSICSCRGRLARPVVSDDRDGRLARTGRGTWRRG